MQRRYGRFARERADALRLDAYDAPAGAGDFYARCGFQDRGRATYRGCPLSRYELMLGASISEKTTGKG